MPCSAYRKVCDRALRIAGNLSGVRRIEDVIRDLRPVQRHAVEERNAQTVWFSAGQEMPCDTR
ncbi:hypothetical protein HNQ71_006458 [Mesorhizobium sangaii]|uniref:Uncharacterized protein n=1 Tax=Mesorhizobium sangaii TaxID=505389 RepID=A0A841PUB4_9HYPH|nr:hypothetical protein [Mesorhizobium sangaii]